MTQTDPPLTYSLPVAEKCARDFLDRTADFDPIAADLLQLAQHWLAARFHVQSLLEAYGAQPPQPWVPPLAEDIRADKLHDDCED